ncbi:hypothetical protein Pcinc_037146 [Petrolisthes cinctipes]|uniref:C2H2-type domain-containing protein n=1 Tax=Petrolisthes cinctipes TaxID=88211 RepID=A0AAE1BT45_PETCI|nr:hypothetical protein Pcinc_037146 [Petrolisthes cinctipes]
MCFLEDEGAGSSSSPEHQCLKCKRRFSTATALVSHDKFCSLLQMKPDILPESPLNSRIRSETPEKKIAIQIRKDYKKTMTPHCPRDVVNNPCDDCKQNQTEFKIPELPKEQEALQKLDTMMYKVCNLKTLKCIPCDRRYQTISTLKRHASLHFSMTRFVCRLCEFRSFQRYECMRHVANAHKMKEKSVEDLILDDHREGPLRYYLTDDEKDTVSSPEPEAATGSCHLPIPQGPSDSVNNTLMTPEVDCSESNERKEMDKHKYSSDLNSKSNTKRKSHMILTGSLDVQTESSDLDKERNGIGSEDSRKVDGNGNSRGKKQQVKLSKERLAKSSSEVKAVTDSNIKDKPGGDSYIPDNMKAKSKIIKQYALRGYQADDYLNPSQESDSLEDVRWERPLRIRKAVEQKDFIYENKDHIKVASEDVKESSPLESTKNKTKVEDKGTSRRRNLSPKCDTQSKKIKTNNDQAVKSESQKHVNTDDHSTYDTCNGSTQHEAHRKEKKLNQTEGECHQPKMVIDRFVIKDEVSSHNGPRKKKSATCKIEDESILGEMSPPIIIPEKKESEKIDITEIHNPDDRLIENGKSEGKTQVKNEGDKVSRQHTSEHIIWEKGKGNPSQNLSSQEPRTVTQNSHSSTTKD